MARKKLPPETKVESIRHKDKRTNIPTEELGDFIADDEQPPNKMTQRKPHEDPKCAFDCLIVCDVVFDPHVVEEAECHGKLTAPPARMLSDLLTGTGNESLLKNTGAGDLFMVFGEPDVENKKNGTELTVEIKGSTSTTRHPARSAIPQLTTSRAGSSTPSTTARASSSARPTSPAPISRTKSSSEPSKPRSTRRPSRHCTAPRADCFPSRRARRSRSR
jgi:hypothetical protein